jgi:putative membrane protein
MRNFLLLPAAAIMLAVAPGFAQPADQPGHVSPAPGTANDTASGLKDAAGHAAGTVSAKLATTLKGFVMTAADSDMYEVTAGQIARERSQNSQVKDFAAKMVSAHTQTTAKLKSLIASNPDVTPPDSMNNQHQMMVDELRGAKDADFDKRYMSQQVDAHKEALTLMKNYATKGDNPAVTNFAAETAPAVQHHLDMAQQIYKSLK